MKIVTKWRPLNWFIYKTRPTHELHTYAYSPQYKILERKWEHRYNHGESLHRLTIDRHFICDIIGNDFIVRVIGHKALICEKNGQTILTYNIEKRCFE